jgi:hypothetical protein
MVVDEKLQKAEVSLSWFDGQPVRKAEQAHPVLTQEPIARGHCPFIGGGTVGVAVNTIRSHSGTGLLLEHIRNALCSLNDHGGVLEFRSFVQTWCR